MIGKTNSINSTLHALDLIGERQKASITVTSNTIYDNSYNGVLVSDRCNATLTKNIIKKAKVDELCISNYDLEIDNIKDVIEDCETVSLFNPNKVVILNNCNYFNRIKCNEEDISDIWHTP